MRKLGESRQCQGERERMNGREVEAEAGIKMRPLIETAYGERRGETEVGVLECD